MKKVIYLLSLIIIPVALYGQSPQLELYVQDNAFGLQKGYALNMKTEKAFSFGVFYQSSHAFNFEQKSSNNTFKGVNLALRIIKCGKLSVHSNLKAGLVQNTFFVITPEVQTNIAILKTLDLGLNTGYRVGEPAFSLKLMFHPFIKTKK